MSAFAAFLETDRMYFRKFREADDYDADMLHGWDRQDRRAVKCSATRADYLKAIEQRRP
jgi:hypothetical protein